LYSISNKNQMLTTCSIPPKTSINNTL